MVFPLMGCYGIGVSRIIATCIEKNNDNRGIIWPFSIAPFSVHIIGLGQHGNEAVKRTCDQLFTQMNESGIEVLLDDRDLQGGEMLADCDLLGCPVRVVVSPRSLADGSAEIKLRRETKPTLVKLQDFQATIQSIVTETKM